MPSNQATVPYRWLSQVYDEVYHSFAATKANIRDYVLRDILPSVRTACDLACGTGTTALELAHGGIRVYAVDLSAAMCRITREKVRATELPIRVLRADMRTFRLPEQVDLITCESDALNHVPRRSDLRAVARAMARALRPGGYAFFDVNNAKGFRRYWSGEVWIEKPHFTIVMRNGHTPAATNAWSDIEIIIRDCQRIRRHRERVQEVCWSRDEVRRIFNAAGFDRIRAIDEARFYRGKLPVVPGCRTAYLVHKAE